MDEARLGIRQERGCQDTRSKQEYLEVLSHDCKKPLLCTWERGSAVQSNEAAHGVPKSYVVVFVDFFIKREGLALHFDYIFVM
jgi:hypothetical protein